MKQRISWWLATLALAASGCGGSGEEDDGLNGLLAGGTGAESATEGAEGAAENTESSSENEETPADGTESAEVGAETPGDGEGSEATEETSDPATEVDIRADTNRNGTIDMNDPTEDEGEDVWDATRGAIFLANIDDDEEKCPTWGLDVNLPKCKDSADEVINGELDLLDLARLQTAPLPGVSDSASASINVGNPGYDKVNIFVKAGEEFVYFNFLEEKLTAQQIRDGVELAIEAKDVVRDAAVWNGYITVSYSVNDGGENIGLDTLQMRVSPMMLYHHLLDATVAYVAEVSGKSSADFRADFVAGLEASGGETEYFPMQVSDQWSQDYFETGYTSMPSADGGQHAIRVNFRSANVDNPGNEMSPLRPAGQVVFQYLRGIDSAPIQEYDLSHPGQMDSLDSFGNTETIPPYTYNGETYPLGRIFRGSTTSFYPDEKFSKMLEDQMIQPPVYVDTSWLLVGHVDETISFVRADTELGWKLVQNDAQMAIDMLEDLSAQGYGDTVMFAGKSWSGGTSAEISIDEVLDDEEIMAESLSSAEEVEAQVAIIRDATGLTDDDIIRIPYLHWTVSGYSVAYQPGTVNGILINQSNFMPPKPHGPVIDGKDVMEAQFEEAYGTVNFNVHWVEDWDLYHRLLGEVHCGSNATREIPEAKWWETGR